MDMATILHLAILFLQFLISVITLILRSHVSELRATVKAQTIELAGLHQQTIATNATIYDQARQKASLQQEKRGLDGNP